MKTCSITTKNNELKLLLKRADKDLVVKQLKEVIEVIEKIDNWQTEEIEKAMRELQEKNDWHRGQFFMMARLAVTGRKATPPLFETMTVLEKDRVLSRLNKAIELIG